MTKKILIYSFKNRFSFKFINKFKQDGFETLIIQDWDNFLRKIISNRYKYILGLGDYRKNAKFIQIETKFINLYGNVEIDVEGPEYFYSKCELLLNQDSVVSNKVSNGPCNKSGYLALNTITNKKLNTKFVFVHIPTSFNFLKAENLLVNWLNEIKFEHS